MTRLEVSKILRAAAYTGLLLLSPLLCSGQSSGSGATPGWNGLLRPRWAVMTATDPDAARIASRPVPTTIAALLAQPRPAALPLSGRPALRYRQRRFAPVETTLWSVEADLIEVNHADDGDYHLLLRDTQGRRMVCELPDPKRIRRPCRFAAQMARARGLLGLLRPGRAVAAADTHVQVTGVGYFGAADPLESSARNGVQLHPLVSIAF